MKKIILALSVVLIVLFSGCISVSHDVKVSRTGELEKYDTTINTSSMVYSMLNSMSLENNVNIIRFKLQ